MVCSAVHVQHRVLETVDFPYASTPAGVLTLFPQPDPQALPLWITPGPDGRLWFTEDGSDSVWQITTSGVLSSLLLPPSSACPRRKFPQQIVTGPDGSFWLTEQGCNAIGRLTPSH